MTPGSQGKLVTMKSQAEAVDDALYHSAQLVDNLQDADAPEDLINQAEELQSKVNDEIGEILD